MAPAVWRADKVAAEDPKPATAPTLLRRDIARVSESKPTTKPHTLTPQFHWNLNQNALQWLTDNERKTLYELFRFYDSSFQGDALPAIHCERLLQLLRDARLLATQEGEELSIRTVEKIFAQAVLGTLRAYLDADEQPALTFQLFSGALLNCALHKFRDEAQPESAFKRLIHALIYAQPEFDNRRDVYGLLQHSELAFVPTWSADGHETADSGEQPSRDFLQRQVFQQVLTGLSHDKLAHERLTARLETLYDVPEGVASHFNAETVALVKERFRTFDVFERGVLPRDEVFALLSGVAKKLEIVDVYEVLAVILAGNIMAADRRHLPRGSLVLSSSSSVKDVSLEMILQALHVCRRSRSAAYASSQSHSHPQHASRRVVGGDVTVCAATPSCERPSEPTEDTGKTKGETKGSARRVQGEKRASGSRGKAAAQRAQQLSHKTHGGASKGGGKVPLSSGFRGSGPQTKRSFADTGKHERKATVDQAALLRRLSKMSASSSDASSFHARETDLSYATALNSEDREASVRADSFRSIGSSSSSSSATASMTIPSARTPAVEVSMSEMPSQAADRDADDRNQRRIVAEFSATGAVEIEPILTLWMFSKHNLTAEDRANAENRKRLNGAICWTAKLCVSATVRRIVVTQGVYFHGHGDLVDVWNTQTQKIDERMPLEGAVVVLRQLVAEQEREGFVLFPTRDQRDAMDQLQQKLRDACCPRYAKGVHSPAKPTLQEQSPLSTDAKPPNKNAAVAAKQSLDRGRTSDLLHFQRKKQQSLLLMPTNQSPWSPANRKTKPALFSEQVAPLQEPHACLKVGDHDTLRKAWGHEDDWVLRLNAGLHGSRSLPSLAPSIPRRQRPRELLPIPSRTTATATTVSPQKYHQQ